MAYVIEQSTVSVFHAEALELFNQHYEELTLHKDIVKLNIDWEAYYHLERAGKLVAITARLGGVLVGYSVFTTGTHPHYKNLMVASNDILFLTPPHRKGRLGIKLIKESEQILSNLGVQKLCWHVKYETTLGPLLEHLGYGHEEFIVAKILGDHHGV